MRQIYKRLLTTLVLISATQTSSVVKAEGIRLVGPSGEVQSSPRYAEEIERALPAPPANSQPSRFIGPTGENQTLWSIASQIRPSRNVSVQQTLLAIYRLNPQAFENQNIHELIPGSRLRVPSLEQVQSATTKQAVAIMKAHEARLKQTEPAPVERAAQQPKPQPKVKEALSTPQPKATVLEKESPVSASEPVTPVPPVNTSPQGEQQVSELKNKLQGSQSELASLEEKNHRLRLMLSEVQNEVQTLKSELNDEERIRSEVEKLLTEERQRVAEQERMQPSTLDKILSNGWLVGLAALVPGALIAFLIVMLLGRRSKEKEEQATELSPQVTDPLAVPIGLGAVNELEEELSLEDDLFADDESESFDKKDSIPELEDDVFANLDDEELDFNLEGDDGEDPFAGIGEDGDLDVGFDDLDSSTNGITVNGEEKALGLEEMERALDEVPPDLEVLDEPDFDLSDEDSAGDEREDAFAELLAEETPAEKPDSAPIDQAALDDLFAELDSNDLDLDSDSSPVSDNAFSAGEASDDEIDKLLAQYEQPEAKASTQESEQLLDSKDVDSLELDDEISGLTDSADEIDENSTDLLDELIDVDDEEANDEFDPLSELESLSGFDGKDIEELDENSVDLLDELLDDDVNTDLEDEETSELDPFDDLIREDEAPEIEPLNQEEDDVLVSLGFDDFDNSQSEKPQDTSFEVQAEETTEGQFDADDIELESGLDIDALLDENQTQSVLDAPALKEPEEKISEESESEEFWDDIEDISLEYDPLMRELDELFESSHDDMTSTEQDDIALSPDLDAPFGEQEESIGDSAVPSADTETVEPKEESLDDLLAEESETEPVSTPTPNAVANEFGIPLEEDWLLDEFEPESEVKQDQESAVATSSDTDEEEFNFDELELPEFSEEDALASMADEPEFPESEVEASAPTEDEEEFDFDESELPEFSEEDALASMADEPELTEAEVEAAVLTEDDEEFNFDESELPEFDEEDALASMSERTPLNSGQSEASKMTLQADNDHDALFEVFAKQSDLDVAPESHPISKEAETSGFTESEMESLLSEKGDSDVFEGQLDSDTIDSAGMDFETMLDVGDDWDGFKPTSDNVTASEAEDVPEDQREVWRSEEALTQPEIEQENWEQQSDLDDFDPKKSQFMTIDELMAQVDQEGGEFEEEDLKLDVGLNEFPDVIGDINDVDVDSDAEAAGKLDLAKIYLEMNDPKGAIKLLEEAIVYGEDDIRREAKNLIDTINGR